MRFLPIVTQIFLWAAVFEAIAASGRADRPATRYDDLSPTTC